MRMVSDTVKNRLLIALFCVQFAAVAQPVPMQPLRGHVPAVADPFERGGPTGSDHWN